MATGKSQTGKFSALLAIGILILYFIFFKGNHHPDVNNTSTPATASSSVTSSGDKAYRHHPLHYTKHARCRMDCRHINETEVNEILQSGEINNRKSEINASPCPKYALEGITNEHQHLRIIVGDCDAEATIITVIDLDHDFECDCH